MTKRKRPLEQLKYWLETGLPGIDEFDKVARKLTREEEEEYLKYLDRHNKVWGSGFGPLPPKSSSEVAK